MLHTHRMLCCLKHLPLALMLACSSLASAATTPQDLLANYSGQTQAPASPSRGQPFFANTHGSEWSCASCHGAVPTKGGKHASTGKAITPLAPAFNPERFTDPAKVEKWFRRNCKDVLARECTAAEKADVLAWLISLKP